MNHAVRFDDLDHWLVNYLIEVLKNYMQVFGERLKIIT